MMLVHKPQNIILSSPVSYTHRRHPSAPVVVQPTRTPGLLSLSKPAKQSTNRALPSQQRRDAKQISKTASGVVRAHVVAPAPTTKPLLVQAVPATPSPSRGRNQTKQAKDKAQTHRSASQSSVRGKHGRQPSPPITTDQPLQSSQLQFPSQAEATVVPPIKSTNLFDPFLDSPPPSPTLSKPSGKLASRRQQTPPASPLTAHARAIPVPVITQRTKPIEISRSDPAPSHMRPRPVVKRSSTYQDFPVCDDLNEGTDKPYILTPPATPRRFTSGNRSITLSARAPAGLSFNFADPVTPVRPSRKHQRVPSEGVFNMSSDEELSSGPGGVVLSPNVQALFASANKRASLPATAYATPGFARAATAVPSRSRDSSPFYGAMTKEQQLEQQAQEKAGFFASSMFQNSPSPEELPDPLLL